MWVRRFFVFGGSVEKRLETLHYTAKSGIFKRTEGADCVGGIFTYRGNDAGVVCLLDKR